MSTAMRCWRMGRRCRVCRVRLGKRLCGRRCTGGRLVILRGLRRKGMWRGSGRAGSRGGGEDGVLGGWWLCGVLNGRSGREECCAENQEVVGSLHDRAVYPKRCFASSEDRNGVWPKRMAWEDTGMTMASVVKTSDGAIVVPSYFPGKQWQQVLERDARADGQFMYAVKSTKIYCKPSCASRRPTRKQVSFFPTPAQAEAAGYRACKRGEPEGTEAKADPQAGAIAAGPEKSRERADSGGRTRLAEVARAPGA